MTSRKAVRIVYPKPFGTPTLTNHPSVHFHNSIKDFQQGCQSELVGFSQLVEGSGFEQVEEVEVDIFLWFPRSSLATLAIGVVIIILLVFALPPFLFTALTNSLFQVGRVDVFQNVQPSVEI